MPSCKSEITILPQPFLMYRDQRHFYAEI
uniref:Uncharacterized protein n=1 Tax=Anguilla anguilla TaxID=7936 RepID=A0A0E9Y0Y5_ANGAN